MSGRGLLLQFIRESNGLSDGWQWFSFKVLDHKGKEPKDWRYAQYEGAVYPHLITRGPRKGLPNYRKPEPGTERTCIVDDLQYQAWLVEWEARMNKCCGCEGSGEQWRGWDATMGDKFSRCFRCGGTGHPPIKERVA